MGCFDSVAIPCPKCKEIHWAQSKSGLCLMYDYELETCPEDILWDVNRHAPFKCEYCGAKFKVEDTESRTITLLE